jgi:hypothetical protein
MPSSVESETLSAALEVEIEGKMKLLGSRRFGVGAGLLLPGTAFDSQSESAKFAAGFSDPI